MCIILRNLYEENQYNLVFRCCIIIFLYNITVFTVFFEVKLEMCLCINIHLLQIMLNTQKDFELYMYILAICKEAVSCIFIFTPIINRIEHYLLTCTYLYSYTIYYYERNNCRIIRFSPEVKVINKILGLYLKVVKTC